MCSGGLATGASPGSRGTYTHYGGVSDVDPSSVVGGSIVVGGPLTSIRACRITVTGEHGLGSPLSLPFHDRGATKNPASQLGSAGFAIRSPRYTGDQTRSGVLRV